MCRKILHIAAEEKGLVIAERRMLLWKLKVTAVAKENKEKMKNDFADKALELINAHWEEPECKHARHASSEKRNIEITQDRLEATYFRQQSEEKGYSDFTFHLLMEGDALKQLFALAAAQLSLDAGNPRVQERVRLWVTLSMDQQWSRQKQGSFIGPVLGAAAAYLLMSVLQGFKGGLSLGLGLGVGGIVAMIILRKKRIPPLVKKTLFTLFIFLLVLSLGMKFLQ